MKQLAKLTLWILTIVVTAACDTSELENRLNNLELKIAELEKQVGPINSNAIALDKLMRESIRIVGFTAKEGGHGYELSLSDGSIVNVTYGETAPDIIPIIGIDEKGRWVMSFDGNTFEPIEGAGNALSEDGMTPQVRINAKGEWEVSVDGGKTWKTIIGKDGKPQSAVNGAGNVGLTTIFKDIIFDKTKGEMIFDLLTGQKINIAIVDDFYLNVNGYADNTDMKLGEIRRYKVEASNVKDAMFYVPEGWSAFLENNALTVTAPAAGKSGQYTLTLILTSTDNLLKQISLKYNLVEQAWNGPGNCQVYEDFVNKSPENILLDFSYAGYMHGESAPLEATALGYKVFDVTKYGAIPNDGKSDRQAFLDCVKAATGQDYVVNNNNVLTFNSKDKANAIVYFPEGEFILHTSADDNPNAAAGKSKSQTIQIRSGNFIIRGAGMNKTTIVMQDPNLPADPKVMYSSPAMIELKHNSGLSRITDVTKNAAKGSFSVEVASTVGLAEGQWVCLTVVNNDPAFVRDELAAGKPTAAEMKNMTNIVTVGVQVYDYHQIKSIQGNVVTFVEPIMHEVDLKYTANTNPKGYNWRIDKFPHYENVGVEDLTFKGNAKDHFIHHGSWEDDGAYKPVNMTRLTNSWMRRVGFESVSEACSFTNCANCSAYEITLSGRRGHASVRSQVSTRIFIGATLDKTDGYMIDNGAAHMVGAGQYHAVGVSKQSMGTVLWRNRWGDDSCFESHATQPRATLVDCCKGGWMKFRQGGDQNQVPNHLADLTVWNFESTTVQNGQFGWWDHASLWWKFLPPIIVGFHGQPATFDQNQIKADISNGIPVNPESLYEAQLKERLGAVPAWLVVLKK